MFGEALAELGGEIAEAERAQPRRQHRFGFAHRVFERLVHGFFDKAIGIVGAPAEADENRLAERRVNIVQRNR